MIKTLPFAVSISLVTSLINGAIAFLAYFTGFGLNWTLYYLDLFPNIPFSPLGLSLMMCEIFALYFILTSITAVLYNRLTRILWNT